MADLGPWVGQSLRFALVAPLVFAVDWGVLHALQLLGASPQAGRLLSLPASVLAGFALNRRFTFRAEGRPTWIEARGYVVAAALGIVMNYAVFTLAIWAAITPPIAIAAGMLAAAGVTFLRFRTIFAR